MLDSIIATGILKRRSSQVVRSANLVSFSITNSVTSPRVTLCPEKRSNHDLEQFLRRCGIMARAGKMKVTGGSGHSLPRRARSEFPSTGRAALSQLDHSDEVTATSTLDISSSLSVVITRVQKLCV